MRIQQSSVSLDVRHSSTKSQEKSESMNAWVGERPPTNVRTSMQSAVPASASRDTLTVSPEARQALALLQSRQAEVNEVQPPDDPKADLSPRDQMIITILERMFGIKFRFVRPVDLKGANPAAAGNVRAVPAKSGQGAAQTARAGWGFDYQARETYSESEQTSVSGQGVISTADGKQINFTVQLNMSREFHSEHSISVKAGDALVDPLVINYAGKAAELSPDKNMTFDLNLDGKGETFAMLQDGSGYLALDKNGDGVINNGAELFGPSKGDGFVELGQYDADQNNWIDENDPIYKDLRVWSRDDQGNDRLFALGQLGIGAIYLGGVDAPFTLKDGGNQALGQVQKVSVFARENGSVGTVQQLDVVV